MYLARYTKKELIGKQFTSRPRAQYVFRLPAQSVFICTEDQANEFRRYEKREIMQKLMPGEITPRVHTEGYVTIEQYDGELPSNSVVSLSDFNTPVQEAVETELTSLNVSELENLHPSTLKKIARDNGLSDEGGKQDLIDRITNNG
ncbi:MAG: hypothetical protein HC908_11820 [Calothrix sp. SM1_7_51]|nr:hypothetical protein [Calothrix sp. SM1_7_51]